MVHRQDIGRAHLAAHGPSLLWIGVRIDPGVVSADGQDRQINTGARAQGREGVRIGRVAAEDKCSPILFDEESAVATMPVREGARAPVIDLDGLYARAIDFNALAPREIACALEAAHEIKIALLDDGVRAARQ